RASLICCCLQVPGAKRRLSHNSAQKRGKTALICEEGNLPLCSFRAESRSFSFRICPKNSLYCFGANEATIFSKRGSPRSGSQTENSLLLGNVGPFIGAAAPCT